MHYLSLLPSLITALILCICDIRTRTVPRFVVISGVLTQLCTFMVFPTSVLNSTGPTGVWETGVWKEVAIAFALALACGTAQLLLCLIAPHAIGLGDATASVLISLGIAYFHGFTGLCTWWVFIGVFGLGTITVTQQLRKRRRSGTAPNNIGDKSASIAFVPVLTAAAVATYFLGLLV